MASDGSSCTVSGVGDIFETVRLLPGGTATFFATGQVSADARGEIVVDARIDLPSGAEDLNPLNDEQRIVSTVRPFAPQPDFNSHAVVDDTPVSVTFLDDIVPESIPREHFVIHGAQTGRLSDPGDQFAVGQRTAVYTPANPLRAGDLIQVTAADVEYANGDPSRSVVWQFRVRTTAGHGLADSGRSLFARGEAIEFGDLNGDGHLDALITDAGRGGETHVWTGGGIGNFTKGNQKLAHDPNPSFALGDVDGDGDLDVVIATSGRNRLWLNNGQGRFSLANQELGEEQTTDAAFADLDADGDLDLLTTNADHKNEVWINDGRGGFSLTDQALDANGQYVELGDIDNDGDLDAVITSFVNLQSKVDLWFNDGQGFFSSRSRLHIHNALVPALGDLDNDGNVDIFLGGNSFHGVSAAPSRVLLNDGLGNFTRTLQSIGIARTNDVGLADLDADGDLDAVLSNGKSHGAPTVWLNDGSAQFVEQHLPPHLQSDAMAIGDLDGNGSVDALFGNRQEGTFIWLNAERDLDLSVDVSDDGQVWSAGDTVTYQIRASNSGPESAEAIVTDTFPDQLQDISWTCVATPGSTCAASGQGDIREAVTIQGDGYAEFTVSATIRAGASDFFRNEASVILANGTVDFALVNNRASDTNVVSPMSFDPSVNALVSPESATITIEYPDAIDPATVDGSFEVHGSLGGSVGTSITVEDKRLIVSATDGFRPGELVTLTSTKEIKSQSGTPFSPVVWQFRTGPAAASNEDAGFLLDSGQRIETGPFAGSPRVVLADLNGDQLLDAIVTDSQHVVWINDGGTFANTGVVLGNGYDRPLVGDLDNDGDLDVVSGGLVWRNSGGAEFKLTAPVNLPNANGDIGDVNGDGYLDLVFALGVAGRLLYLNDGNGSFFRRSFDDNSRADRVSLADIDGDGDLDVHFAGGEGPDSYPNPDDIWLNNGLGSFYGLGMLTNTADDQHLLSTGVVVFGDLDGDGDLDMVSTSKVRRTQREQVTVWEYDDRDGFQISHELVSEDHDRVSSVALGDLDGDGDLDVMAAHPPNTPAAPHANQMWLNTGQGAFVAGDSFAGDAPAMDVALGDVNGDGTLDAFFATQTENEVWLNRLGGDHNQDGQFTDDDIDLMCLAVRSANDERQYDLNRDGNVDIKDYHKLIREVLKTGEGDANVDGIFNSEDLVQIFRAGEYDDELVGNSRWGTGDWTCDGEFDSGDLVAAFRTGTYVAAAQPAISEISAAAVWIFDQNDEERKHRRGRGNAFVS